MKSILIVFASIIALTTATQAQTPTGAQSQNPQPVQITPADNAQNMPIQTFAPNQAPFQIQPNGGVEQEMTPEQQMQAAEASQKAAAEAEAQRKAQNIKKFSHLLPEIEKETDKMFGFWESYWGHVIVAVIIGGVVLWIVFKRHTKYIPTPYEIAKNRLELSDTIFLEMGAKAYAREVSQAVRDYIEAVHHIPAPERTTEEFLAIASQSQQFDHDERTSLAKMLKLADMAKFAQHSFREEEKNQLRDDAKEFIRLDHEKCEKAKREKSATARQSESKDADASNEKK